MKIRNYIVKLRINGRDLTFKESASCRAVAVCYAKRYALALGMAPEKATARRKRK